jgi:hypothetical protein
MSPTLKIGVAVLRWADDDDVRKACCTLYSHHLVKLDRCIAQAQRHATHGGGEFAGVAVEIDAAGAVSVNAAALEPLVL